MVRGLSDPLSATRREDGRARGSSRSFPRESLSAKGHPKPQAIIGDVIDWTYSGNRYHPTEKPLSVLTALIAAFTPPRGLVLDPFAGSGSTLLAARSLSCRYLGIELDAKYHAIACDRLTLARQRPLDD